MKKIISLCILVLSLTSCLSIIKHHEVQYTYEFLSVGHIKPEFEYIWLDLSQPEHLLMLNGSIFEEKTFDEDDVVLYLYFPTTSGSYHYDINKVHIHNQYLTIDLLNLHQSHIISQDMSGFTLLLLFQKQDIDMPYKVLLNK